MFKFKKWSLLGVILVLVGSLILVLLPIKTAFHYELRQPLVEWMPEPVLGWIHLDLPIATTLSGIKAVSEQLDYTDAVFRVYKRGDQEIKVYVAYWLPAGRDPRLIAVHSPDICWDSGGWRRVGDKRYRTLIGFNGARLINGHDRTFFHYDQREDVVFWHFIGGERSPYLEANQSGSNWWTFEEIFRNPFTPRYEQFFVRISTNGDLDNVAGESMMRRIVDALSVVQSIGGVR